MLTDYAEAKLLRHLVGDTEWVIPSTVYVGAFVDAPSDNDGSGSEVTASGYARAAVSGSVWGSVVDGSITNTSTITIPGGLAAWGTVVSVVFFDQLGNRLFYAHLTTPRTVGAGQGLRILPGSITLRVGSSSTPRALSFSDMTWLGHFAIGNTEANMAAQRRGVSINPEGTKLRCQDNVNTSICWEWDIPSESVLSQELNNSTVFQSSYDGHLQQQNVGSGIEVTNGFHIRGNFYDPTGRTTLDDSTPRDAGLQGNLQFDGKLFCTYAPYYNNQNYKYTFLSYYGAPGQTGGLRNNDDFIQTLAGYLVEIPEWFAARNTGGKRLGLGYNTNQGIAGSSQGPPLFAVDHNAVGLGTTPGNSFMDFQKLFYYPRTPGDLTDIGVVGAEGVSQRGMTTASGYRWFSPDEYRAAAWVDGQKSDGTLVSGLVVGGTEGLSTNWEVWTNTGRYYGNRGLGYGSQGNHDTAGFQNVLYIFDPSDIEASSQGLVDSWTIGPVEELKGPVQTHFWTFIYDSGVTVPTFEGAPTWEYAGFEQVGLSGMAWCKATKRLYIVQPQAYGSTGGGSPLVHVWKLN